MFQRILFSGLFTVLAAAGLTGCAPQRTVENMRAARPQRPPELDKLDAFVGRWEVAGEAEMAGLDRPVTFTGANEAHWEGDGWYLVGRGVSSSDEFGETHGMAIWTYDARSKKFRSVSVNSRGAIGTGTAWHDESTDTWQMLATSRGPSGKTLWKGRVRFIDPNTKQEHWTGHALGGLIKTAETTKTEKRR
jgi:hypothetical protein